MKTTPACRDAVADLAQQACSDDAPAGDNMALAFHKCIPAYDFEGDPELRRLLLTELQKCPAPAQRTVYAAARTQYQAVLDRLETAGDCETFELQTATRLIVGLGEKGALDFGLTFQSPYGVPTIPGSALKGVASAYAARSGVADWSKPDLAARPKPKPGGPMAVELFGGLLPDGQEFSGLVDFLDAWWLPAPDGKSPYELEIVNPHYGQYYDNAKRPPDGMESPIPFPFLALRRGEGFLFAVRGPAATRRVACDILTRALAESGVGGKTALGYGRFDPPA